MRAKDVRRREEEVRDKEQRKRNVMAEEVRRGPRRAARGGEKVRVDTREE